MSLPNSRSRRIQHMHIHCPHCRSPIEVVEDQGLRDVICPSCGSSFNLLPDETITRLPTEHKTLGHFELIDRIGVGAFGEVWTAHDSELDRTVAIKLPRKGQLSVEEAEIFLREARSAARLNHPSIVAVHEVGKADDQLFIVSDYVHGVTLADWLTGKRPRPQEAAALVAQLADAVHHAHEHGVIHRDLKPSNVMLDDDELLHIMDFGLAKRDAGEITMTMDGRVLGTPAYMSPEQAKGAAHDADARSDVYSLGVILFELLTGELPFRGNARMLVHQVVNDEPPSPRRFCGAVPRDLETIVLKCLEKDPAKRYVTAKHMADDLRRVVNGQPIEARPVTRLERGVRWCRRQPLVAGLATAVVVVLFAGLAVSSYFALLANQRATVALAERDRAEDAAALNRRLLYASDMQLAGQAWQANDLNRVVQLLNRHSSDAEGNDPRCIEWFHLWRLCNRSMAAIAERMPQESTAFAVAFSPDGRLLAVGHSGDDVTLIELKTGRQDRFGGRGGAPGGFVAFSHDGTKLVYPGPTPMQVTLRDLKSGQEEIINHGSQVPFAVAVSPDDVLATGGFDGTVKFWDVATGKTRPPQHPGHNEPINGLAFSWDGKYLASVSGDGVVKIWDMAKGEIVQTFTSEAGAWSVGMSPDGQRLAIGTTDGDIRLWEWRSGKSLPLKGHRSVVHSVAFSQDGKLLASAGMDKSVRLWDLKLNSATEVLRGHSNMVFDVTFCPTDDKLLASASVDNTVILWNASRQREVDELSVETGTKALAFTPDGRTLVTLGFRDLFVDQRGTDSMSVWDLTSGRSTLLNGHEPLESVEVSSDGTVVALGASGTVHLWNLRDLQELASIVLPTPSTVTAVACSPDGSSLALGCDDGAATVWNLSQRRSVFEHSAIRGKASRLAFSPDSKMLAVSGDYSVAVWNLLTEEEAGSLQVTVGKVTSLAFKTSSSLVVGTDKGSVTLWNWTASDGGIAAVTVDGTVLQFVDGANTAVTKSSGLIGFWDLPTGQERFRLPYDEIYCLAVAPNATTIAAGTGWGNRVQLWFAATKEEVDASQWWRGVTQEKR